MEQEDGSWRETKFRFTGFDDPFVAEGKEIEFYYSTSNDGRGQIWFNEYHSPPELPDQQYPFSSVPGASWSTGTPER